MYCVDHMFVSQLLALFHEKLGVKNLAEGIMKVAEKFEILMPNTTCYFSLCFLLAVEM